jgi:ATP-dependent DNA helicase DinG
MEPPVDEDVATALARVTAALPGAEIRPGQIEMATAIARAIGTRHHLIVQAGTGTGKSLAYLVPALTSGHTAVIATATKALQDQLATKDLPFLAAHLGRDVSFAVLKGRSNYLCLQRLHEATTSDRQLGLELGPTDRGDVPVPRELAELAAWAATTETGDRADLETEPSVRTWNAVSVGPRECPGAKNCPQGATCFAERARTAAASADVIVVNTHLYGLHLSSGGTILPEHDVVIIDEAHQLEDTISATSGLELAPGRFRSLARAAQAIVADDQLIADLAASADHVATAFGEHLGRRLRGTLATDLGDALVLARGRIDRVVTALRAIGADAPHDAAARKQRAMRSATSLTDDIDATLSMGSGQVGWIEGPAHSPVLKVAPLDIAPLLVDRLWGHATAILTSATIPAGLAGRIGLDDDTFEALDVGSPFDYGTNALLYCAADLPDPRAAGYDEAMHDELEALIGAAGGRTLALFTSYRAMEAAADALRTRLDWPLFTQHDFPKGVLLRRFAEQETSCLFATMSFWQGVDVPGRALCLVTIDRLPFPRPDEPLLQARREQARADAFRTVDLPRATTLLAQGAGRLIRNATDRGVVAVLDRRLATNTRYRWDIIQALPPMSRTRVRGEAETFLRDIRDNNPVPMHRSS